MSSTDQLGSSLGSFPTSPSVYPYFGLLTLCQASSGGRRWQISPLLSFYMDGFGIKLRIKVDKPLNKEIKQNILDRTNQRHPERIIIDYKRE